MQVRTIPLTQGFEAIVSLADFERVSAIRWRLLERRKGRRIFRYAINGRIGMMHRFILGAPDGVQVDHANGDGLDNRRSNLRLATQWQQSANSVKRTHYDGKPTSSQYKGVYWNGKKWIANIVIDYRTHYLGSFSSEIEAARVYDTAAREAFGDFARTNF